MSAATRVAPPTAAATGLGLRDRVRSRTRANASPGRAENASARFAVGGEPSATALRASRDDHSGRFGDDSYGYERPLEGARKKNAPKRRLSPMPEKKSKKKRLDLKSDPEYSIFQFQVQKQRDLVELL